MKRLKKGLSNILSKLSFELMWWAVNLDEETEQKVEKLNDKNETTDTDFALRGIPTAFTTFAEGLASKNYCTRHDAAAKVVSYYVDQKGSPLLEDLIKSARVLLEDTLASEGDISYLVGAWKDQASATTEALKEEAQQREDAIYHNLKNREKKALEARIKSAQDKLQ